MSLKCRFGTYGQGISVYSLVLLWWLSTSLPCMRTYSYSSTQGRWGRWGAPHPKPRGLGPSLQGACCMHANKQLHCKRACERDRIKVTRSSDSREDSWEHVCLTPLWHMRARASERAAVPKRGRAYPHSHAWGKAVAKGSMHAYAIRKGKREGDQGWPALTITVGGAPHACLLIRGCGGTPLECLIQQARLRTPNIALIAMSSPTHGCSQQEAKNGVSGARRRMDGSNKESRSVVHRRARTEKRESGRLAI